MGLVSASVMLHKAHEEHYAVGHFNLNNMEFVRAFLLAAQEMEAPIILGVTGGTAKYMGGYRTITDMVTDFSAYLHITVPVALHVDHGTYEQACDAVANGFSSVMYDGSHEPFEQNLARTRTLVALCAGRGISVEAEVGGIGGDEDGHIAMGECADVEQCVQVAQTGVDMLAAGIGNIHGVYPPDWAGLNFPLLEEIGQRTGGVPLVLHGGSGIPQQQIEKAIRMGVAKINVNTECQLAFTGAVRKYVEDGRDLTKKGFPPRALLADGLEAAKAKCMEKIQLFGSAGKA